MAKLTPKQLKFTRHLFEGKTQGAAYKLSYDAQDMTDASINAEARKIADNHLVREKLEEMQRDAEYVAELSVAWVLKQYMMIATADPSELIEVRRVCCRYCYGVDFNYQWIDADEWARAIADTMDRNAAREKTNARATEPRPLEPLPTSEGGFGFWANEAPHSDCPHCFGNGSVDVHLHDTRKLSPGAKLLYAGVKTSANGVEVKMRDQDGALGYLAKFLGIDKKTLELQGPGGTPIQSISTVTSDPVEASKMYAAIVSGKTK